MSDNEDLEVIRGTGNVWQDLGYSDADIRQAKDLLAARIIAVLDDRALSTRVAARETGFAAADFSRVRNANYGRFTLDRLIRMLHALDDDVEVRLDVSSRRPHAEHDAPRP
jgi:predicted XRE-type DNA-binding protein